MLDFIVTDQWWQKYESGEKNTEFRRKTPYWDKRVRNALTEHYGEYGAYHLDKISEPLSEENNWLCCRFPWRFPVPANVRHGYTSEKRRREIYAIIIKNGKDTDLAIDDWVYCFCFEQEVKTRCPNCYGECTFLKADRAIGVICPVCRGRGFIWAKEKSE